MSTDKIPAYKTFTTDDIEYKAVVGAGGRIRHTYVCPECKGWVTFAQAQKHIERSNAAAVRNNERLAAAGMLR